MQSLASLNKPKYECEQVDPVQKDEDSESEDTRQTSWYIFHTEKEEAGASGRREKFGG